MKIGMVFQESALFDSMNVRDNVAYQLHEKARNGEVETRVRQNLGFVGLEDAIEKFPPNCPVE
jgi:phospholipid/cholesterol/gamma-HCH transport system ATP-binding protein